MALSPTQSLSLSPGRRLPRPRDQPKPAARAWPTARHVGGTAQTRPGAVSGEEETHGGFQISLK